MQISTIVFSCLLRVVSMAFAATHYLDIKSTHSVSPHTSWETVATDINDEVDAAIDANVVLTRNGTYLISTEIRAANDFMLSRVQSQMTTCESPLQKLQYDDFYSRAGRHAEVSVEGIGA